MERETEKLRLAGRKKTKRFNNSLRMLINFLYALVFGFGLIRLYEIIMNPFDAYRIFSVAVAFIALLLGFWWYNWASVKSASYGSALHYAADCLMIFLYWGLFSFSQSVTASLFLYAALFFMYPVWQFIGTKAEGVNQQALIREAVFAFIFLLVAIVQVVLRPYFTNDWLYSFCVLFLLIIYRIISYYAKRAENK